MRVLQSQNTVACWANIIGTSLRRSERRTKITVGNELGVIRHCSSGNPDVENNTHPHPRKSFVWLCCNE
eukprot:4721111-Ditylum_brightwellii.AAC.1